MCPALRCKNRRSRSPWWRVSSSLGHRGPRPVSQTSTVSLPSPWSALDTAALPVGTSAASLAESWVSPPLCAGGGTFESTVSPRPRCLPRTGRSPSCVLTHPGTSQGPRYVSRGLWGMDTEQSRPVTRQVKLCFLPFPAPPGPPVPTSAHHH